MRTLYLSLALLGGAALGFGQPAKPAMELKYAVIVTRHGVRSPTWTSERLDRYSTSPWPDFGVPPGNLTEHGRVLMKMMGEYYRDRFSSQGLLGGPNCSDARRTYFWADTDQRTMETARALAEGILPGCKVEVHSLPADKSDPLFDPIEAGTAKPDPKLGVAAVTGRIGPKLDALIDVHRPAFDALNQLLNGKGKAANSIFDEPTSITAGQGGIAMAGPLRLASTLTENLLLEYTNGMSGTQLGWGRLTASNLQQIMSLHTAYADLMRRTPYLAQARGSNLLNHVLRTLEQVVTAKPVKGAIGAQETVLSVVSGHDTNISNLSGMLRLSWVLPSHQPDDVPPGSALIFSLWKSTATGRYWVRLQFIAQTLDQMHAATPLSVSNPPPIADLFVPGCSTSAVGYACDWTSFVRTATEAIAPDFVEK